MNVATISMIDVSIYTYKLITVTNTVTISEIGRYLTDNALGQDDLENRICILLADFAEKNELGFLSSEDGSIFVFYEKAYVDVLTAQKYL